MEHETKTITILTLTEIEAGWLKKTIGDTFPSRAGGNKTEGKCEKRIREDFWDALVHVNF